MRTTVCAWIATYKNNSRSVSKAYRVSWQPLNVSRMENKEKIHDSRLVPQMLEVGSDVRLLCIGSVSFSQRTIVVKNTYVHTPAQLLHANLNNLVYTLFKFARIAALLLSTQLVPLSIESSQALASFGIG